MHRLADELRWWAATRRQGPEVGVRGLDDVGVWVWKVVPVELEYGNDGELWVGGWGGRSEE